MSEMAQSDYDYYTVPQAAQLLDVSPSTIWRWIAAEKLPAYRVGPHAIRIKKQDLEAAVTPAQAKRAAEILAVQEQATRSPNPAELVRRSHERATLQDLLAAQRIRPVADPEEVVGGWPDDEDFDLFIQTVLCSRDASR